MKIIKLAQGKETMVDDDDFERYENIKFYSQKSGHVARNVRKKDGGFNREYLHRLIMGLEKRDTRIVDHINHNPLDNRKSNLRICTTAQNLRNSKKQKNNTSGFIGVSWHKNIKKYVSTIGVNGKKVFLGSFNTKDEANNIYQENAKKHYGDFKYTEEY